MNPAIVIWVSLIVGGAMDQETSTHRAPFSREVASILAPPLDLFAKFISIKGNGKDGRYPRQG